MGELLVKLDIWNLLLVSAIVTFVTSAVKVSFSIEQKHKVKILAFVISVAVTFLNVSLTVQQSETFWQEAILQFLMIWSFATLFNALLGNWFIDKMFNKVKDLLSK